jgi:hypothetical protein
LQTAAAEDFTLNNLVGVRMITQNLADFMTGTGGVIIAAIIALLIVLFIFGMFFSLFK